MAELGYSEGETCGMMDYIAIKNNGVKVGNFYLVKQFLDAIAERFLSTKDPLLLVPTGIVSEGKLSITELSIENIPATPTADNSIVKLEEENAQLKKALTAVRTLMNHSEGVAGLHLNGNVATWDELLAGDEAWLTDFRKAELINRDSEQ
jgi:hypothetical protein